jgi:hypothetical protein
MLCSLADSDDGFPLDATVVFTALRKDTFGLYRCAPDLCIFHVKFDPDAVYVEAQVQR